MRRLTDQLFQKATTTELRGHSLKLYKKSSRLELRKHFFSQRIVDHWNKLPDKADDDAANWLNNMPMTAK